MKKFARVSRAFGKTLVVMLIAYIIMLIGQAFLTYVFEHKLNWKVVWAISSILILTPMYYWMDHE
jgi:hypothetical protein